MSEELVQVAISETVNKGVLLAQQIQLLELFEGSSTQALDIGSFTDEGPILDHLHHTVMPSKNATFNESHHEIYLSDFRKTKLPNFEQF